jgi:hypothetical protein
MLRVECGFPVLSQKLSEVLIGLIDLTLSINNNLLLTLGNEGSGFRGLQC